MELTHLSPVQYGFIEDLCKVSIHRMIGKKSCKLKGEIKLMGE
jgi:hypothetical protein